MKNIITLTESDLYRIVKKVIKENYSEEHLKYTNPKTGDECEIKMAKRKNDGRYSAVLTCDIYNNGSESVIAELPIITRTKEQLIKGICNNIEKMYDLLDKMLMTTEDDFLVEAKNYGKFRILDDTINCSADMEQELKSWDIPKGNVTASGKKGDVPSWMSE